MAKPRVFISSTYYDLQHIRAGLDGFITSLGFEPVLFEQGEVTYDPDKPLDESCFREVETCQLMVLIIGGRYGSPAGGEPAPAGTNLEKMYARYNSITKGEYESAERNNIPVYIFVNKDVLAEYKFYRKNRERADLEFAHVDSVNVYRLLDDVMGRANPVQGFEGLDDITKWLQEQWAGLFAEYLSRRGQERTLQGMADQLAELSSVTKTLKTYSESIVREVNPEQSARIIASETERIDEELRARFENLTIPRLLAGCTKTSLSEFYQNFRDAKTVVELARALGGTGNRDATSIDVGHSGFSTDALFELRRRYFAKPFEDDPEFSA